jgi:hypothetical protein
MIPPNHANVDAWSKLVVAGMVSPGVVSLTGHERAIGWDEKSPKGTTGGTSSRTGEPLGKFVATFYLVDEVDVTGRSDFDEWDDFQRLLESSICFEEPVALEVYHPDLARNFFSAVVLRKMGAMQPDGKGGATIAVELGEHRPEAPKTSGATGGTKTTPETETAGDRAVREAEAELDALLAEGEAL